MGAATRAAHLFCCFTHTLLRSAHSSLQGREGLIFLGCFQKSKTHNTLGGECSEAETPREHVQLCGRYVTWCVSRCTSECAAERALWLSRGRPSRSHSHQPVGAREKMREKMREKRQQCERSTGRGGEWPSGVWRSERIGVHWRTEAQSRRMHCHRPIVQIDDRFRWLVCGCAGVCLPWMG